ncbi:hypothetical protein Slin14017_G114550 [Septoria linicola]|nr:hypothetical protein Slin14017_G114550 [Septoria linicola]
MEREQLSMLKCLQQNDYRGMVEVIHNAELVHAQDYHNSRITDDKEWKQVALFLLAQRSRLVLEAILDGTLPERTLNGGDLSGLIREPGDPREWQDCYDPVVYLNWLAAEDGRGLPIADFEHFLTRFEAAAELDDVIDPNMRGRINYQYGKIVNYRTPDGFYDTFENASMENYRDSVREILNAYRTRIIPAARALGLHYLSLKPEAGWSMYWYERAIDHRKLRSSSPHAMRLAHLVLNMEFPGRRFRMYQFCLFDIVHEEHAAIGESIASQICASYNVAYGGFNTKQAGIADNSTRTVRVRDWQTILQEAEDMGYLGEVPGNLANYQLYCEVELRNAEETSETLTVSAEIETLGDQVAELEQQNVLAIEQLNIRTASTNSMVERVQSRQAGKAEERDQLNMCRDVLRAIAEVDDLPEDVLKLRDQFAGSLEAIELEF